MKPISESIFFHLVSLVFRHSWFGMPDVENHSPAGTVDIARSGKISGINVLSLVQPLVEAGVIENKDATLIESYLLINLRFLKIC